MVIDRNMAIGEGNGFENKCYVYVGCVGWLSAKIQMSMAQAHENEFIVLGRCPG